MPGGCSAEALASRSPLTLHLHRAPVDDADAKRVNRRHHRSVHTTYIAATPPSLCIRTPRLRSCGRRPRAARTTGEDIATIMGKAAGGLSLSRGGSGSGGAARKQTPNDAKRGVANQSLHAPERLRQLTAFQGLEEAFFWRVRLRGPHRRHLESGSPAQRKHGAQKTHTLNA